MQNNIIIKWATDLLVSKGYSLENLPKIIQETLWSKVILLSASKGDVYLKQPAPLLAHQFNCRSPFEFVATFIVIFVRHEAAKGGK